MLRTRCADTPRQTVEQRQVMSVGLAGTRADRTAKGGGHNDRTQEV
jgi:hypothetical protein